jgi:hypothetical protein
MTNRLRRYAAAAALGAALLAAALSTTGCFNPFRPRVGSGFAVSLQPPKPTRPQELLRLFKWCWENRGINEYEEIFTDDFRFAFSVRDSVNNLPITRDEEVEIGRRLFVDGTATEPRANRITLDFGSNLLAIPDSRPGKTYPWHQEITTRVILRVELDEENIDVEGDVTFFIVRGDSALIPQQLKDRGFGPDPNRWYIERWEDKTGGNQATGPSLDGALVAGLGLSDAVAPARDPRSDAATLRTIRASWGELQLRYADPFP